MHWRALKTNEHFKAALSWPEGRSCSPQLGYTIKSLIYFHRHENCLCDRSKLPECITWFLPHHSAGGDLAHYPMNQVGVIPLLMIAELRKQIHALRIGFLVHVDDTVSFGEISID